jgi:hypothetical protein
MNNYSILVQGERFPDVDVVVVKIPHDINGNPRYYIAYYYINPKMTKSQKSKAALRVYRGKKFVKGYVFQSYELPSSIDYFVECGVLMWCRKV